MARECLKIAANHCLVPYLRLDGELAVGGQIGRIGIGAVSIPEGTRQAAAQARFSGRSSRRHGSPLISLRLDIAFGQYPGGRSP